MAGKAITKETIKRNTIREMQTLGVYKPQYDPIVEIYAELHEQYERLTKQYKKSGYQYEISTDQGGVKKAPIVATLEVLRKDLLQYADRLCLHPKAVEQITTTPRGNITPTRKKGKLAATIYDLGDTG